RPLPALRGRTALRRAATTVTPRLGTLVAADHPQGDSRRLPRPPRKINAELNNRPRRILGYRTPAEVFADLLASSIASIE
ncbi:MAG: hypothetical protein WBV74_03560, partial [Pseudonocardiaceae bacterium]